MHYLLSTLHDEFFNYLQGVHFILISFLFRRSGGVGHSDSIIVQVSREKKLEQAKLVKLGLERGHSRDIGTSGE